MTCDLGLAVRIINNNSVTDKRKLIFIRKRMNERMNDKKAAINA